MSDAAAFFANKKKKKKAFKFNANLVDVSTVTATVHVDAPALTTDQDPVEAAVETSVPSAAGEEADNKEWDDEAMAAATTSVRTAPESSIRDMKTTHSSGGGLDPDNIAEKLRVQETKAQLAAARQGMEREALKLKEEREQKEKAKEEASKNRFGAAAVGMSGGGGGGGKWVPSRLRSQGGGGGLPRIRMGAAAGGGGGKLDVQDQELFPDLASADKILEKKEKDNQPHFKPPKKTPVGGGASWASKMVKKPKAPEPKPVVEEKAPEPEATPKPAPVPAPAPAAAPKIVKKATKKKKKDLSTFKPTS